MFFTPGMLVALLVAAFFVVSFLVLFLVALLQKGRVSSFMPLRADEVPELPAYFFSMSQQAAHADFSPQGIHGSGKPDVYTWFWLSPCAKTMAVVATWKAGWIRTKVTLLASRLQNGGCLITTDDLALFQWEFSGLEVELVVRANFRELLDAHDERLAGASAQPKLLAAASLTKELETIDLESIERLEKRGYVRFLDPAGTSWRYTMRGALQCYFQGWWRMFRKGLAQWERANRKRPGDN